MAASFFIYIRAFSPPPLSAIRFTWGLARRVSFHMHNSGRHPCVAVRHFLTELWKGASSTAGGGNDADCYHRDDRAGHHLRDAFHCADSIVGTAIPACHRAVWPTLIPRMVHFRRYWVEACWSLSFTNPCCAMRDFIIVADYVWLDGQYSRKVMRELGLDISSINRR